MNTSKTTPKDVYFITQQDEKYVKIGIAENVDKRLADLQDSNPQKLKVVNVIKGGGRFKERELHKRFAHLKTQGEWFKFTKEIKKIWKE